MYTRIRESRRVGARVFGARRVSVEAEELFDLIQGAVSDASGGESAVAEDVLDVIWVILEVMEAGLEGSEVFDEQLGQLVLEIEHRLAAEPRLHPPHLPPRYPRIHR